MGGCGPCPCRASLMPFPAWIAFHRDEVIRRHSAAQVLYADLLCRPQSFYRPVSLKAYILAEQWHFTKETVLGAMNLLVTRGYLTEHARGQNNVRSFTVNLVRSEPQIATR